MKTIFKFLPLIVLCSSAAMASEEGAQLAKESAKLKQIEWSYDGVPEADVKIKLCQNRSLECLHRAQAILGSQKRIARFERQTANALAQAAKAAQAESARIDKMPKGPERKKARLLMEQTKEDSAQNLNRALERQKEIEGRRQVQEFAQFNELRHHPSLVKYKFFQQGSLSVEVDNANIIYQDDHCGAGDVDPDLGYVDRDGNYRRSYGQISLSLIVEKDGSFTALLHDFTGFSYSLGSAACNAD